MLKLYLFIISFFIKRKCLKYIDSVHAHLSVTEKNYSDLESGINALYQKSNTYIPQTLYRELVTNFFKEYDYFKNSNPFNISKEMESKFQKIKLPLPTMPELDRLFNEFNQLKEKYMNAFNRLKELTEEMSRKVHNCSIKLQNFFDELSSVKQDYIAHSVKVAFIARHQDPYEFYKDVNTTLIEDTLVLPYLETLQKIDSLVDQWNLEYIERELIINREFFDDIDGKALDEQQRVAVLTDEDNNLVLAGAGSGKTLTISGKVKFLTKKKNILPEEILLISFTKKAAKEMFDRITKKLDVDVDVKTFHKLGLDIIATHTNKKQDILKEMIDVVNGYMKTEVFSDQFKLEKIITFFGVYLAIPKDLEGFESLGDYHDHHCDLNFETLKGKMEQVQFIKDKSKEYAGNLQTLKGETVKSVEETLISNYLFLNGIEYVYEKNYEFDTRTLDYRQYKPDFYLPEYGIYIEHFGVTENMRAPWLEGIEEEKYIEGMIWKQELHKEKNTILIESYSYYNRDGILLSKLNENLLNHKVKFKEIDLKAVFDTIYNQENNNYFAEFIKLIMSFLGLFKSNGYTDEKFDEFLVQNRRLNSGNIFLRDRNQHFLTIARPIYNFYQAFLVKNDKIDFNDMINKATKIANFPASTFPYKYIIIDEYQDISRSRFNLIKAIKDKTQAKVICVGDDWQSIYRFAGSDIQLFTQFQNYFGKHTTLRIERTYRNSQQLIDIAGKFVMENKFQLPKDLKSNKSFEQPIRLIAYNQNMKEVLINTIETIVEQFGLGQRIMLLGRNKFDINFLKDQADFELRENKEEDTLEVIYYKYESLNMVFFTIHKSKGLERDQVILLNAKNAVTGFPNRISDDPVLKWVLTDSDTYQHAEERRLFYVALTRTQGCIFILVPENEISVFVKELIKDFGLQLETTLIKEPLSKHPACLKCKTGVLVERKNQDDVSFLGCSNYPGCDNTYSDIQLLNEQPRCEYCNSYKVLRLNKGRPFHGCSNFWICNKNKLKLKEKLLVKKALG